VPTPEQIESVLERSPVATVVDLLNRAIVAFTWLTGVRDGALVTLKLRHVDLAKQLVDQDPREVKTKNSKQLRTTFFGVGGSAERIVVDWIAELRRDHLWGNDDPLFPATAIGQNSDRQFGTLNGRLDYSSDPLLDFRRLIEPVSRTVPSPKTTSAESDQCQWRPVSDGTRVQRPVSRGQGPEGQCKASINPAAASQSACS